MAYIGTSPSNGVRRRFVYEATASQTSFSGNDENGITLTYVDSLYLDVFQNGIKLKAGDDYTATTGTSVVLVQGASVNDVVEMVAFDVFSVNDSVSASDGGSFAGNVAMGGTLSVSGAFTSLGIDDNADATAITIDSSENVLVSATATSGFQSSTSITGSIIYAGGGFASNSTNDTAAVFNRQSTDGNIVLLKKAGASVGAIGINSATFYIGDGDTTLGFNEDADIIMPRGTAGAARDNAIDLGNGSNRFDDIHATNGTIQTSDRNEKQDIEELTDAEKRVAVVAKGLMRKFRWKDKVAEKGDDARTHFGIIAQDLQDAFTAESLDASDYAMFISTTWWEKEISVDAVVADESNGIEAKDAYKYMDTKEVATTSYTQKTRLGVRYSELLAFIISAI